MLLLRAFQRADGWCESVPTKESSLTPESTLRRMNARTSQFVKRIRVVEYGCPVIGFGLHRSPRETVRCEASVIKVVPRIVDSSLRLLGFKDFFIVLETYK